MSKAILELKVGIFVLAGLIILIFFIFSIGDFYIFKKGFNVTVQFNDAGNLKPGAPVNLMGIEIGEVKSMSFVYNKNLEKPMAELLLWIKEGTKIKEDAVVTVRSLSLMGEKYVDITPGIKGSPVLKKGGSLYGQEPVGMEDVTEEIYYATKEIKAAVSYMNDVLSDKKTRDNFKETLNNTKELTEKLDRIIDRIEKAEGTMGKLINEDKIYKDLEEFVADIKKHPWKLLIKTKEKKDRDTDKDKREGFVIQEGSE